MTKKKIEIKYVEVEGIKCEVKNPNKKETAIYYQNSLREAIDNYIGSVDRWSESKRNYRDNLKINVIIAPFVLGWLKKPEDNDEYLVIKGYMTLEELDVKIKKGANKKKRTRKTKTPAAKSATKKPAAPKKPTMPKKPTTPKKPNIKSITKNKATTKKAAPKTSIKKSSKKS